MRDKPKRPRLRFHLLTLVLMTMVLGLMIWPNIVPNPPYQYRYYKYRSMFARYYGWPACCVWRSYAAIITEEQKIVKGPFGPLELSWIPGLFIDGAVIFAAVGGVAYASESMLRHREDRES